MCPNSMEAKSDGESGKTCKRDKVEVQVAGDFKECSIISIRKFRMVGVKQQQQQQWSLCLPID